MHARCEQLLCVVHNKEQVLRLEVVRERLNEVTLRLLSHAQRPGYGFRYKRWIGQRGQLHQPNAILELTDRFLL